MDGVAGAHIGVERVDDVVVGQRAVHLDRRHTCGRDFRLGHDGFGQVDGG